MDSLPVADSAPHGNGVSDVDNGEISNQRGGVERRLYRSAPFLPGVQPRLPHVAPRSGKTGSSNGTASLNAGNQNSVCPCRDCDLTAVLCHEITARLPGASAFLTVVLNPAGQVCLFYFVQFSLCLQITRQLDNFKRQY